MTYPELHCGPRAQCHLYGICKYVDAFQHFIAGIRPKSYFFCHNILLRGRRLANNAQNVAFFHDQQLFAVYRHLIARPFAEQNFILGFDVKRHNGAVIFTNARANGDDNALRGFFLSTVGNNNAASRFGVFINATTKTRSCKGRNVIVKSPIFAMFF